MAAPADTEIVYAHGCGIRDESTEGLAEAVEAARNADVAVLVVGGSSARQFGGEFDNNGEAIISEGAPSEMDCGEGVDVASLKLGGVQERLVREIHATGTPVVVIVIQGRPHELTAIDEHCGALLCAWYPGTEGGQAIGEILFGRVNPSGKLPVSLPRAVGQLPVYYNQKKPSRIRHYADSSSLPLYPFGYGLSYTTFRYTGLRAESASLTVSELRQGRVFEISVDIENTGKTAGAETVQLYIQAGGSSITRRRLELKAFEKILLVPGGSRTVTFLLDEEKLSIWNRSMDFALEPCRLKVMVGTNSTAAAELELELAVTGD